MLIDLGCEPNVTFFVATELRHSQRPFMRTKVLPSFKFLPCDFYVLGTRFRNFRDCKRELNLLMTELIYFDLSTIGHRVSILTFILLKTISLFPRKAVICKPTVGGCGLPN